MIEQDNSIAKRTDEPEPDSFEALRDEGIALLQSMSGDVWTDYNLHDPGVTILEQVCFALTDLAYRSDFDVADHLAEADGSIDFAGQSLHRPEDILPSAPWTISDHRRAILDTTPDADNIWFATGPQHVADGTDDNARYESWCPGLYLANVRLRDEEARGTVAADVVQNYAVSRGLCEDLHADISVLQRLHCALVGVIDIDGQHPPAEVLGTIFYRAVLYIASNARHELDADGSWNDAALLERFEGPPVKHNRLPQDGGDSNDHVLLSTLVGIVQDVPGVVRVSSLALAVGDESRLETETVRRRQGEFGLWLTIPKGASENSEVTGPQGHLVVQKSGRAIEVPAMDAYHKFYQLITTAHEARRKPRDLAAAYTLPVGHYREFRRYHSVRHHFPDTYGIGERGLGATATTLRKAQADQLRAYLALYDQVMTNHLAQVDSLRHLFADAVAPTPKPTYAVQALDDLDDTDGQPLAIDSSVGFLEQKMARFDAAPERRSRQLDHMLALFGERFSQKSLRHFDQYATSLDRYRDIVRNKAAFARDVTAMTRERVGGMNYFCTEPSGFARRVSRLLGFESTTANCTEPLDQLGVSPTQGEALARSVHDEEPEPKRASTTARERALELMRRPGLAGQLLAAGTRTEHYALAQSESELAVDVGMPSLPKDNPPRERARSVDPIAYAAAPIATLDRCESRDAAQDVVRELAKLAKDLCRQSEGLHVIEHVLLRPARAKAVHDGAANKPLRDPNGKSVDLWGTFYPLRFSVFFPNWTARCQDPAFRKLAEETVRINSPSHVYGECYWLDFDTMRKLEKALADWRLAWREDGASGSSRDQYAMRLIGFCVKNKWRTQ